MTPRTRKLVGTVILVPFICLYALTAMVVATRLLPELSSGGQAVFYVVGGLLWVLPAGWLIKWMSKNPDVTP